MPRKNTVKIYIQDGIYHVYNRGVEKRKIFIDDYDYKVFINCLKTSLSPPIPKNLLEISFTLKGSTFKGIPRQPKNFHGKIECIAYCLMPNHFHLLIKQLTDTAIKSFMQSLATRYSLYFNKKYKRIGSLFQSIYKATLVSEDNYLLHLSRYIHLNPQKYTRDLNHAYSSYADYTGIRRTSWLKPEIILANFNTVKLPFLKNITSYQKFVESYKDGEQDILSGFTLEEDND